MGKWQQHTSPHGPKFANQLVKYQDDLSYFRRQGPYTYSKIILDAKILFASLKGKGGERFEKKERSKWKK